MFDSGVGLGAVGSARLAELIDQNHVELMVRECRMLELACAWADAHYLDSGSEDYQPLVRRACAWGGEGTPEVSEYCAAELGALQGTGMAAARMLIADALDLRYRLPRLWGRVLTGGVRAWQARRIAEQTRPLSWEACADVDHALSDCVGMMPWPRFATILAAAILEADPTLANQQRMRAKATQDVFAVDSEDGLKTIVAKAAAGDAVWFLAAVNRIAEILAVRGDTDPVGARRAKAVGIVARPAEALLLLIEHQHDTPASESAEPSVAAGPEPGSTAKPGPGAELEPDPEADDHRSLEVTMPPGLDVRAARPKVVFQVHLSDGGLRTGSGLVRPEHGGPITLDEFVEFLGRTRCTVNVQPVLDPTAVAPVDGYEVPQRLRAAVRVQQIADVFPFGTCISANMDLDHTERYVSMDYGGPPAKPGAATSARSPDPDTGRPPTAAGPNTNPNPATSCTAHRSATCTSSPPFFFFFFPPFF